ncbi:uncharacterized protein si:dkey-171c9.3 [Hoplias malabaricus]|uniref:uncharacterized protein si:dkey-171c9.3 n=1 Tax=Hoplias malabaricus TaxID=27720 RepID=UPI0034627EB6
MTDEWLSSKFKLCHLNIGPNTDLSKVQGPGEVVFNTQSYPQPDYEWSSILFTLEAYRGALDETQQRRSDLNLAHSGENLGCKPVQTVQVDVTDQFAEMLSRDILDTSLGKMGIQSNKDVMKIHPDKMCTTTDPSEVTSWTVSAQEKLATKLASEIFHSLLAEVSRHCVLSGDKPEEMGKNGGSSGLHGEHSSLHWYDQKEPDIEGDSKMEENESANNDRPFEDTGSTVQQTEFTAYSNPLNDLANMGSLDYPDAPPSTPLLPEMMKSRASFTRKLKGGLAKEFLPSPPPPTPKDQQAEPLSEDKLTENATDKSEFVVRLMRSLSLACSQYGDLEEEQDGAGREDEARLQNGISTLSEYAARLSANIIDCITTAQPSTKINGETPVRDVQLLASHLTEEIIIMSVAEVMGSKIAVRKQEQHVHTSRPIEEMASCLEARTGKTTLALGDSLLPRSSPDVPDMEAMRALAGRLIASTLVEAVTELGKNALQHAASQQIPDEASEPMPFEKAIDQGHEFCLNTTKTRPITNSECYNGRLVQKKLTFDSRTERPMTELSFAEKTACEVLRCSVQEASNSLLSFHEPAVDSERLDSSGVSQRGTEQTVLTGFIWDKLGQDIKELQCVLLWAAASLAGTFVLQLDVLDSHIEQQLGSLSLKAQFLGWTVADLMASLLQYCEDLQAASRGHYKNDRSLLGHLLL